MGEVTGYSHLSSWVESDYNYARESRCDNNDDDGEDNNDDDDDDDDDNDDDDDDADDYVDNDNGRSDF